AQCGRSGLGSKGLPRHLVGAARSDRPRDHRRAPRTFPLPSAQRSFARFRRRKPRSRRARVNSGEGALLLVNAAIDPAKGCDGRRIASTRVTMGRRRPPVARGSLGGRPARGDEPPLTDRPPAGDGSARSTTGLAPLRVCSRRPALGERRLTPPPPPATRPPPQ